MFLNLTGEKNHVFILVLVDENLFFLKAIMEGLGYCKPEHEPERKFNIYECWERNP